MSAIVIDIGGTHIRCAVADENASLLHVQKKRVASFLLGHSPDRVWEEIIDIIAAYEQGFRNMVPKEAQIVISFPGPIAHPSHILSAPTLVGKDAEMPDLQSEIAKRTGRATYIINDISAAAWHISRTMTADRFLVVTVSSGIGSKIFDRLHPRGVLDDAPFAGEIGHIKIDASPDAPVCDCGGRGHLGAIASGRGIERFARLQAKQDKMRFDQSACVTTFHGAAHTLTNEEHIVPAAKMHDAWALDIIRRGTGPLARALLLLTAGLGLDRIAVIGGFAVSLGTIYLDILRNEMMDSCDFEILSSKIPDLLTMDSAHEEACLQGAAIYALSIKPR